MFWVPVLQSDLPFAHDRRCDRLDLIHEKLSVRAILARHHDDRVVSLSVDHVLLQLLEELVLTLDKINLVPDLDISALEDVIWDTYVLEYFQNSVSLVVSVRMGDVSDMY